MASPIAMSLRSSLAIYDRANAAASAALCGRSRSHKSPISSDSGPNTTRDGGLGPFRRFPAELSYVYLAESGSRRRERRRRRPGKDGRAPAARRQDRACRAAIRRSTAGAPADQRRGPAAALGDPLVERVDLLLPQPPLARELAVAGLREPRRHQAAFCGCDDRPRARDDIFILEQAEGRRGPRPVAAATARPENGRDVYYCCCVRRGVGGSSTVPKYPMSISSHV